jgi:hypothetical protein
MLHKNLTLVNCQIFDLNREPEPYKAGGYIKTQYWE